MAGVVVNRQVTMTGVESPTAAVTTRLQWAALGEAALRLPALLLLDAICRQSLRLPQLTSSAAEVAAAVDTLDVHSALLVFILRVVGDYNYC